MIMRVFEAAAARARPAQAGCRSPACQPIANPTIMVAVAPRPGRLAASAGKALVGGRPTHRLTPRLEAPLQQAEHDAFFGRQPLHRRSMLAGSNDRKGA